MVVELMWVERRANAEILSFAQNDDLETDNDKYRVLHGVFVWRLLDGQLHTDGV
jgi:hypothetical protein